jgi:dsDNA-specific endonuclease/ATPase MutS2
MSKRRSEPSHGVESAEEHAEAPIAPGDKFGESLDSEGNPVFVVPIEEAIDLHTFQPREVLGVVDAYLDAALELGFREVRLIHGRGKGVQRANVQRNLAADSRVERYADAPQDRGGWGATLVWLRSPDPASRD